MEGPDIVKKEIGDDRSLGRAQSAFRCAVLCEVKKCCKKYKRGKRCGSCPKKK